MRIVLLPLAASLLFLPDHGRTSTVDRPPIIRPDFVGEEIKIPFLSEFLKEAAVQRDYEIINRQGVKKLLASRFGNDLTEAIEKSKDFTKVVSFKSEENTSCKVEVSYNPKQSFQLELRLIEVDDKKLTHAATANIYINPELGIPTRVETSNRLPETRELIKYIFDRKTFTSKWLTEREVRRTYWVKDPEKVMDFLIAICGQDLRNPKTPEFNEVLSFKTKDNVPFKIRIAYDGDELVGVLIFEVDNKELNHPPMANFSIKNRFPPIVTTYADPLERINDPIQFLAISKTKK